MSDSVWPHRRQPTRLPHEWDSPGKNTGVGCHFLLQCIKVKRESEVAQSCLTLCNPMDCHPPGSSIHGIFQARVLEWGAIAFSAPIGFISSHQALQGICLPSLLSEIIRCWKLWLGELAIWITTWQIKSNTFWLDYITKSIIIYCHINYGKSYKMLSSNNSLTKSSWP